MSFFFFLTYWGLGNHSHLASLLKFSLASSHSSQLTFEVAACNMLPKKNCLVTGKILYNTLKNCILFEVTVRKRICVLISTSYTYCENGHHLNSLCYILLQTLINASWECLVLSQNHQFSAMCNILAFKFSSLKTL